MTARRALRAALVLALAAGLFALVRRLPVAEYGLFALDWVRGLGPLGPVVVAVLYVFWTVLLLPGSALTLGAGFLFGVATGTLTVMAGSLGGATAAFLVGRFFARGWVARKVSGDPRFSALDSAIGREGLKIVLLVRLSPIFPFNVLNYALSITSVRLRDYVLGSLLGMFPATVFFVWLGSAARSLTEAASGRVEGGAAGQALFYGGLLAAAAAAFVVARLAGKAMKGRIPPPPES